MPNSKKRSKSQKKISDAAAAGLNLIRTFNKAFEPREAEDNLWRIFHLAMISEGRGGTLKSQEIADDFYWFERVRDLIRGSAEIDRIT